MISGLKFKLVKSNSCSSRLELAGTGLEKVDYNARDEMRNIIHSEEDLSSEGEQKADEKEQEESVKDMVSRLESRSVVVPTKPRIIESKCIEKVSKEPNPKVTINQQSFEKVTKAQTDLVTVNNHLNSMSSQLPTELENRTTSKVVRNRDVDLAFASVIRKNENLKNTKAPSGDTENLAANGNFKEQLELSNIKQSRCGNICKMESVEMVKNQDKINTKADEQTLKSSQKSAASILEKQVKMVNWSTVGSSFGKEYIANDHNLIQAKTYDEMEFEEFEVMGEQHYDSLNSK